MSSLIPGAWKNPTSFPDVASMRRPVALGKTRPIHWRLQQLERLSAALAENEAAALEALARDLGKPALEASFELVAIRQEIALSRRHLRRWMTPRPVPLELILQPGRAWVERQPLGCVLIIGPWNYPLQLTLRPLVSALAAGNSAVVKPSEQAPHTAELIAEVLQRAFPPEVVQVVLGDAAVAARLLEERFDHVFFTGGSRVGSQVMGACARSLTPVTLELGGKSPVIVLKDADLAVTARRIAWGKWFNAGQTCVGPDHLLVEQDVRDELVAAIASELKRFHGPHPLRSDDLGRIVNDSSFQRLEGLLCGARRNGQVLAGGRSDRSERWIEPTLLAVNSPEDPLMEEELFGPLLPVLTISGLEEALELGRGRACPLVFYLFSRSRKAQRRVLEASRSGGVVFNDVVVQVMAAALPFGGVGASGMGSYHGEAGFRTFSHERSVLSRAFLLDIPLRYPPYAGKLPLLRRLTA